MKIERATMTDMDALAGLYFQLIGRGMDRAVMEPVLEQVLRDERYHLLVARDEDGAAVGTALGIVCLDPLACFNPFFVVEDLVVDEGCRGRGAGRALMEALEAVARQRGCAYMMLVSGRERQGAHALYRALGYSEEKGFRKALVEM